MCVNFTIVKVFGREVIPSVWNHRWLTFLPWITQVPNDYIYGSLLFQKFVVFIFLIFVVSCIEIQGWRNPTRCNSMQIFMYCLITLHVLGVHHTYHQEYIKLTADSGTDHTIWKASFFRRDVRFEEACFPDSMTCTRGCNSFYVLLMMGVMDAWNM